MKLPLRSLIPLLACLLAAPLQAQVASPALNLGRPALTSAAVGWREDTSIQASYFEGNGKRRQDGSDVYEFSSMGTTSGLTLPMWMFTLDAQAHSQAQDTTIHRRQEGTLPIDQSGSHVALALTGNDSWFSLGVGVGEEQQTEYLNKFYPRQQFKQSSLDGSLSLKFGDWFYLGNGVRQMRDQSDFQVDLHRSERLAGVGMVFGKPGESRFRLEISRIESPKGFASHQGEMAYNRHEHELTDYQEVEVLIQGLLFSGRAMKKTTDARLTAGSTATDLVEETRREGGVIWVPQEGLYLGFTFINETLLHPDYEDSQGSFQINTGYLF